MAVSFPIPRIASVCSDGELIQRTGEGDRAAFDKLYRRYARPVFGLALRRLGDRGRADTLARFSFTHMVAAFEALYMTELARYGRRAGAAVTATDRAPWQWNA